MLITRIDKEIKELGLENDNITGKNRPKLWKKQMTNSEIKDVQYH